MQPVNLAAPGVDFTRAAVALAVADGDADAAERYAIGRWGAKAGVLRTIKAAQPAMTSSSAPDLLVPDGASLEFFQLVMERSIIGRLSGIRRTKLRVKALAMSGATAGWVAEGAGTPVTVMAWLGVILAPLTVRAAVVVTNELLRGSDPQTEAVIRNDLVRATTAALDVAFVDPANTGDAVTPASITSIAVPVAIAATADPTADLKGAVAAFDGDLTAAVWVTSPEIAAGLHGTNFPLVGLRGGTLIGAPVIVSRHVPAGVIVLVDPTGIVYGAEQPAIQNVGQGDVEMSTTPTQHVGGVGSPDTPIATTTVSLFTTNSRAIAISQPANWEVVRPGSVALITGATYGSA